MKKSLANKPAPRQTCPRFLLPAKVIGGLLLISLAAGLGLLASRPAHTAGGPVAVTVANTPLATTTADRPDKQPFQQTLEIKTNGAQINFATVPVGKRLVIESITAFSNTLGDTHSHNVIVLPEGNDNGIQSISLQPSAVPYPSVTEKVLLYAEANDSVLVFVQTSGSTTPDIFVTLTGYYADVP